MGVDRVRPAAARDWQNRLFLPVAPGSGPRYNKRLEFRLREVGADAGPLTRPRARLRRLIPIDRPCHLASARRASQHAAHHQRGVNPAALHPCEQPGGLPPDPHSPTVSSPMTYRNRPWSRSSKRVATRVLKRLTYGSRKGIRSRQEIALPFQEKATVKQDRGKGPFPKRRWSAKGAQRLGMHFQRPSGRLLSGSSARGKSTGPWG